MLSIENLQVRIAGQEILKGLSLEVKPGQVHALMGLNGSGKSTLANVLAGREDYEVSGGHVSFQGENLLELEPEKRAALGLFLAFQYPVELPGVLGSYFLRTAYNSLRKARGEPELSVREANQLINTKLELLKLKPDFLKRGVNEGFSGGEKKRNEILQLLTLDPQLAVLDESDSGLDIDALKVVAEGINIFKNSDPGKAVLLITHYQRLLNFVVPDVVHVMIDGRIVQSGGPELAEKLEAEGYEWVRATAA